MDNELKERNLRARNTCKIPLQAGDVWRSGDCLQIFFSSTGCRFRDAGYCTMCDYGGDRNVSVKEAIKVLEDALADQREPVQEILLGTCGSILDDREMPWFALEAVLRRINKSSIPTIILETHYTTIKPEILKQVQACVPEKEVVIEMGLESADLWTLEHSIGKFMDLNELLRKIRCIKDHRMGIVLNVLLGAPFLTEDRQLEDAKNSVEWAVEHGADRVVVFPLNIRPNTLVWELYSKGEYQPVSHRMLIELLSRLNDVCLERVEVSWYGDRQEAGKALEVIPPVAKPECMAKLMEFYRSFQSCFDVSFRRNLLREISNTMENILLLSSTFSSLGAFSESNKVRHT